MIIAIGSKNRTKVEAVKDVFNGIEIKVEGINVASGVSNQPFSDEETRIGAVNRAKSSLEELKADIGIGLEGGVMETAGGMLLCNWGALYTKEGLLITASGARIFLPREVAEGVSSGLELSEVIDEYTSRKNVRSNEGSIGIFTDDEVNRKEMFTHVVKLLVGQYRFQTKNK